MADYATEEEQVEAIRRWWRDNGFAVIAGLAIGVAVILGWRGWSWYQDEQSLAASEVYQEVTVALSGGDRAAVVEGATTLRDDYGGTTYAALAALAAARTAADAGDLEAAAEWLRWTVDEASGADLPHVARARLARVLAARGENDRALSLLEAEVPAGYDALYAEIRGDVLADRGDARGAAEAYRQALDAQTPPSDPGFVQRKLNALPVEGNGASGEGAGAAAS